MRRTGLLIGLTLLLSMPSLLGQGKFGKDSAECVKYLQFYGDYMKQNNINEAAPLWRKAFSLCPPTASQNMFTQGQQIMRQQIKANRNNPIRTKELVDTLMMLHEIRAEYYPRYAVNARTSQAQDMMNYYTGDERNIFESIDVAIDLAKTNTTLTLLVRYMDYAGKLYKAGKFTDEEVMNAFEKATATIDAIDKEKPSEQVKDAKKSIESLFIDSGVANSDNLVELYTPRLEENPNDLDLVKKIVALLSITEGGLDTDLFYTAVETLYSKEPSHKTAYMLYQMYSMRNDFDQSIKYLNDAIAFEEATDDEKGDYMYALSTIYYKNLNNNVEAVNWAKKAAQTSDEVKGRSYLLIGTIWASLQCSGNDIESRSKFWVAVDYMNRAKAADSSLAQEANTNIASYSKYFPLQADAFMYDVIDGASYTVSCGGLRETTTVRTQK